MGNALESVRSIDYLALCLQVPCLHITTHRLSTKHSLKQVARDAVYMVGRFIDSISSAMLGQCLAELCFPVIPTSSAPPVHVAWCLHAPPDMPALECMDPCRNMDHGGSAIQA